MATNSEGWKKELIYWISPAVMGALLFFAKAYMDRMENRIAELVVQMSEQRTNTKVLEYKQMVAERRLDNVEKRIEAVR